MAISAKLSVTGLNEYLAKIQAAGNNIDEAVKNCHPRAQNLSTETLKHGLKSIRSPGTPLRELKKVLLRKTATTSLKRLASVGTEIAGKRYLLIWISNE